MQLTGGEAGSLRCIYNSTWRVYSTMFLVRDYGVKRERWQASVLSESIRVHEFSHMLISQGCQSSHNEWAYVGSMIRVGDHQVPTLTPLN